MTEAWIIALLAVHFYLLTLALCEVEYCNLRNVRLPRSAVAALLLLPEVALPLGGIVGVLQARRQARKQAEVNAAVAHLEWPRVTGQRHCHWQCRDCTVGGVYQISFGRLANDDAASHALDTGHRVEVTETGSRIYQRREGDPDGA